MKRAFLAGVFFALFTACRSTEAPTDAYAPEEMTKPVPSTAGEVCVIATWNVYGYPETAPDRRAWFSARLAELNPHVLCVQEIANQDRVDAFLANETGFVAAAFKDSSDGQDNAIFVKSGAGVVDLPDPEGFQHPAQAAYIAFGGLDLVLVTVHLTWSDEDRREAEKALLADVVASLLTIDPDVVVAGDFNTTEAGMAELAAVCGMEVMLPEGQDGVGTTDGGNRYDHFLATPDLAEEEAIRCRIETFEDCDTDMVFRVSDHLPVLAEFRTGEAFRDRN